MLQARVETASLHKATRLSSPIASTRCQADCAPPQADGCLVLLPAQAGPHPPDDREEPKLDDEGAGVVAGSARTESGEVCRRVMITHGTRARAQSACVVAVIPLVPV